MSQEEILNYVEFPAHDIEATKQFFSAAFSWSFEDYGTEYSAFKAEGIEGGFYRTDDKELCSRAERGAALLVFNSSDLEASLEKVESAGGTISNPIFSFPGGRRFHFLEPSGNELAVWSEQ